MKNIYYLYVIFIVSICAVTFPSCQDTLSLGNEKIIGGEGKGLSVNEAREFFEKDMSEKASRSGKDKKEQPRNTYGIQCRKTCEAVFYFSVSSSLNQEAYIRYPLAIF